MNIGQIVQVIGAVVDVQFPRDQMPKVYEALVLEPDENNKLADPNLCRRLLVVWICKQKISSRR